MSEEEKVKQEEQQEVPETWEQVFQHKRFKELNTRTKEAEQSAKKLKERIASIEAAAKEKIEEAEQEKLSTVEKLQNQLGDLQTSFESERDKRLRLQVAGEVGIPGALVDRLRGSNVEELKQDATALKKYLEKKEESPGVPPKTVPTEEEKTTLDIDNKSPEQIRKMIADGEI